MVKNKDAHIGHDAEPGVLNTMRYYYCSKDLDASYVQIVSPLLNKHPDAITHASAGGIRENVDHSRPGISHSTIGH